MSAAQIEVLDNMFDTHPSLSASLEDFEHNERPSPVFRVPSHHSGFKSDDSDAGADSVSDGPWSPPGWRGGGQSAGSAWYRHQPYLQESRMRASLSPSKSRVRRSTSGRLDDDPTLPANIPLPRGSLSPTKELSPEPVPMLDGTNEQERGTSAPPPENHNNCEAETCLVRR